MSIFDAAQHPRNPDAENTGEFGFKIPTPKELEDLGAESFGAPSALDIGETLIYSHADGDFDGAALGIDGIEVTRLEDGSLHAQAYMYLDFACLTELRCVELSAAEEDVWLDKHKGEVASVINFVLPSARMDDDDANGWADRRLLVDLTPVGGVRFPDSSDGVIRLAQTSDTLARTVGILNDDGPDVFWGKVSAAFQG